MSEPSPYTNPSLRNSIKRRLMAKNGGSWSANLSMQLAKAYKAAGGGYTSSPNSAQKSLKKWTGEKWSYSSKTVADKVKKTGVRARYLPKKAWSSLSSSQKSATNKVKLAASRGGKQFVANTKPAKLAGRRVRLGK